MPGHPPTPPLGRRVLAAGAVALAILAVAPVQAGALPAAAMQDRRAQDDALRFVYFRDDQTTAMSGSDDDVARARRYRRSGEPMLWFRQGGREYIVRDPDVLRVVDELWEPVSRIGAEQGRIGARQGVLGAEQGRHGARQGEIGARQGAIGARQGVIGARLGLLASREAGGVSAAEHREIDRERETLDRRMRELDREMDALNDDMRAVTPPTRDVSDEMEELGRQMAVLGGRMDEASHRAQAGMRRLLARAISDGVAQAVR